MHGTIKCKMRQFLKEKDANLETKPKCMALVWAAFVAIREQNTQTKGTHSA